MQKIGLALSGGGAKGFAHIGFLKALEANGLYPDIVTGTSMGGVIGGLYAYGIAPGAMEQFVATMQLNDFLGTAGPAKPRVDLRKSHLFHCVQWAGVGLRVLFTNKAFDSGEKIRSFLTHVTRGADFSLLRLPFACIALDILSGNKITFSQGRLADALYATMALMPFLEPLRYQGMALVDGGAVDNIPVETARELGATQVIGVYVGQQQPAKQETYRTSLDVVRRVSQITTKASDNLQLCRSDLAISMDVRADMFDFAKGQEAMRQGEQAALQNIDRLRSLWGRPA